VNAPLLPPLTLLPLHLFALVSIDTTDISRTEFAADNLYALGEFDAAALEYKRVLFLSSYDSVPDTDTLLTQTKLALALYRNGERTEADAVLYSIEGPMVRMVRAVLLIEEDNPYLAARAVDSTTQAIYGSPAYRLRGWAYVEAGDYTQASEEFRKAGDDSLAVLIERGKPLRLKNPRTARLLSLVPGLGEAYAGRPVFGLWAFAVNAGDTYLIVNALLGAHYLDAFLVYTFLWQRFYSGSMANADRFAHQYNERKIAEALDPIREEFGENEALKLDLKVLKTMHEMSGESGL